MSKQSFALETGGEKRLELEIFWKGWYKNVAVSLDGNSLGVIPNQMALDAGQEFRLIDGSTIKVPLVRKLLSSELQILRNGQPLPVSSSDPQIRWKSAYEVVYWVAGLNLVLGFVSLLFNVESLQQRGIGFVSIIMGLLFFVFGFFVQRKSSAALILAVVIFAIDGIASLYFALSQDDKVSSGLLVKIFFLISMIQGIGAIKVLKSKGD